MKKIILLASLCLVLVGCATMDDDAYTQSGQRVSSTDMGVRYLLGRGVPQNDQKAFDYFLKAADKDNSAYAQNEVAYMYAAGKGTEQNYVLAFQYYQRAANQGLVSAEYNLGLLYMHGLGTAKNPVIGKEFIQKAANQGFEPARQALLET